MHFIERTCEMEVVDVCVCVAVVVLYKFILQTFVNTWQLKKLTIHIIIVIITFYLIYFPNWIFMFQPFSRHVLQHNTYLQERC
jgi:hypothetical protein